MPRKPIDLNNLKNLVLGSSAGDGLSLGPFGLNDEVEDPMAGLEYTGELEQDAQAEANAVMTAFQKRAADEAKRFKEATDSEHWVAVCFQTREQKEEFLRALNLTDLGDKYLDGQKVARRLGKSLSPANVSYRPARIDPKLASRARDNSKGKGR